MVQIIKSNDIFFVSFCTFLYYVVSKTVDSSLSSLFNLISNLLFCGGCFIDFTFFSFFRDSGLMERIEIFNFKNGGFLRLFINKPYFVYYYI